MGYVNGPARTIDEVIDTLTTIVDEARDAPSRLGYFPSLYRKVTIRVKERIDDGVFDDARRIRALDVRFANRYLTAYAAYRRGEPTTAVWRRAFDATERWWPIVLQHLLLGMNAHINLDLGIAVARTVSSEELQGFRDDFDRINDVLAELVGDVQRELAEIWWTLGIVDRFLGDVDTAIINFSLGKARDHAWGVAARLVPLDEAQQAAAIARLDADLGQLTRLLRHPGVFLGALTRFVRLGERGTIAKKIDILL